MLESRLPSFRRLACVLLVLASATTASAAPLQAGNCPSTEIYCTAKVDSQGCEPLLSFTGCPSASAGSGFVVTVTRIINKPGYGVLMYSTDAAANIPFQGGVLCVKPPIKRPPPTETPGTPGGGTCTGLFRYDFNQWIATGNDPLLTAGQHVWMQYTYFDAGLGDANTVGLSKGLTTVVDI